MTQVTVRLHIDPDMEMEPIAIITLDSPLPPMIHRTDEETGLEIIYSLKHRHLPSRLIGGEHTADYIYKGIA